MCEYDEVADGLIPALTSRSGILCVLMYSCVYLNTLVRSPSIHGMC